MGITILGIGSIIGIITLIVIAVLFIAAYTKTQAVYDKVGAALDYAVTSASLNITTGTTDDQEQNSLGTDITEDQKAREFFIYSFNQINNSTYNGGEFTVPGLPANVKLLELYKVEVGDPIPAPRTPPGVPHLDAGTAKQPGYVVHVEAPIWNGGLWNIDPISIDFQVYRALQSTPLANS